MLETSARLLRLLSLLQTRKDWSGAELADRLGVTDRTVRRDVDKLRGLGYPVNASTGVTGGYQLGAGAALPPLLLDDDEAVAVAIGLRTAAAGAVTGIEETSVRALAKLEQVLPHRLRRRVAALLDYTVRITVNTPGPTVAPEVLTTIANACRDHERLRLDYRDHHDTASVRVVEPDRLVNWGGAGIWWRGTPTGRTGGRSGWTGSHRGRRRGRGSCRVTRRTRTSRPTCRSGCRRRRGGSGPGCWCTRRPMSSRSGSTRRSVWSRRWTSRAVCW
jgi:biotin operon repressor